MTLYLQDDVSEAKGQEVSDSLLTRRDIKIKRYVSPSQALHEFSASSGLEDLLQEIAANPLPGAIVITPSDVSPAAIDELVRPYKNYSYSIWFKWTVSGCKDWRQYQI